MNNRKMNTHNHIASGTLPGTVSGTALTVMVNINSTDILKTVILAVLGAVVSFGMTILLKWVERNLKR